jgi:predicted permease
MFLLLGVLALLLASWTTGALARSLAAIMPLGIAFDARPDVFVLAATSAFAILATVASGLGPALKLSKTDLVADLKALTADGSPLLGRRFSARNVMVVGQIALSLMLLSTGGLFARGALKAASANPGFSYDRQLLVGVDPTLVQYDEVRGRAATREVLTRVRALPGVADAAVAATIPFGDFHEGLGVERVGPAPEGLPKQVNANYRVIGAGYFKALGLPMVRGREFTDSEELSATAPRVAIVDERFARRMFGSEDPIGQMIRYPDSPGEQTKNNGEPMEIVGIAAPIRDELFDREVEPAIYEPWGRNYRGNMFLHVRIARTGMESDVLQAIRADIRAYDPRLPVVQATTMSAFHDRSLQLWAVRSGGRMFLLLGVLALLLAVVGLYGVKSYIVSQRTREIGIRMALGAKPGDVLAMVLREGAALAAVGVALGIPLAALLGFGLSRLLYDVTPLDPIVFTAAPLLLASAALLATWFPARRATRVTPLTALRMD